MDADQVATFRALLAGSGWLERARSLGRALRSSPASAGGLLVVGTPAYEPWHLTAHLDDESRLSGIPELAPTLIRWSPPPDAPAHLRVGLSRLEAARRGETLFIVSDTTAPVPLLERVNDARKIGATILALDAADGDPELDALAHESLAVPESLSFDAGTHLVSAAAGERDSGRTRRRGMREIIARLLDTVSGPAGLAAGRRRGGHVTIFRTRPLAAEVITKDFHAHGRVAE